MTAATVLAHDPTHGPDGTDILWERWPDGSETYALRAGKGWTDVTWGPPVEMAVASC